jgi:hypothetical protein
MVKKLDKEHLEAITELQQNFSAVMRELGSITIDLEYLESQKKAAEDKKYELISRFGQLRESEEQLLQQLKDRYGDGQINITEGTFTENESTSAVETTITPEPAGQAE